MIARHFWRGESGSAPAERRTVGAARHRAQPLTAPAVSPRTKYFCSEKNTRSGSAIEMNAAAVRRCQFSPVAPDQVPRGRA